MNPFHVGIMPAFSSAALGPLKYSSTTALMGLTDERISLETILFEVVCLSVNTMLTLTIRGVGVSESVYVTVGVKEGVIVAVAEGVNVGVLDGVNVAVGVRDGVKVGV